jgi:hypothetical protein
MRADHGGTWKRWSSHSQCKREETVHSKAHQEAARAGQGGQQAPGSVQAIRHRPLPPQDHGLPQFSFTSRRTARPSCVDRNSGCCWRSPLIFRALTPMWDQPTLGGLCRKQPQTPVFPHSSYSVPLQLLCPFSSTQACCMAVTKLN